jgi:predicted transcriptional regulator
MQSTDTLLTGVLPAPSPTDWSKSSIDALAGQIAGRLNFAPGASVFELVNRLGGKIVYQDTEDWLKSESGSIVVVGEKQFTIYVSNFTSAVRDRFTIAHELGHYILHSSFGKKQIRVARSGANVRLEWEANWFAAGFLMPAEVFRKEWTICHDKVLLAAKFNVSIESARIRVEYLDLH